jgi:hypothetical protein
MGANSAGIYGAQLFRQDDRPRYRRGFTVNIAILTFGLSLATIRYIDDVRRRRKGISLGSIERADFGQEREESRIEKADDRSDEDDQSRKPEKL